MRTRTARINSLRGFCREFGLNIAQGPRAACTILLSIPGVGLLTAIALVAATSGDVTHFKDARRFACRFGLTPKEHSSGEQRRLGRISKRGDRYLRMLPTHGARSVIHAATVKRNAGHPLDPLRTWALAIEARSNRNKAVCALANEMARISYATLRDQCPYGCNPIEHKLEHTPYKRTQ